MMKAIVQVGMKPRFCKFKVTAGIGNKRIRPIWQSGEPAEFGIFSHMDDSYQQ
jgi:hypothetical protein